MHDHNAQTLIVIINRRKNQVHVIPQAQYLLEFLLLSSLTLPRRGHRFVSTEAIQENSRAALKALLEFEYDNCFQGRKKRSNTVFWKETKQF